MEDTNGVRTGMSLMVFSKIFRRSPGFQSKPKGGGIVGKGASVYSILNGGTDFF